MSLFVGVRVTGIVYADRSRMEHGDYVPLAFLPFDTLVPEYKSYCPANYRTKIEAHVAGMQKRAGEHYPVSNNVSVLLGSKIPKPKT